MRISDWSSDVCSSDLNTHGFYGRRTAFNLALPNQGQRIKADLTRPGLVRVECDAHGWMLAWIYVADSPYYALTGEDGSFSLTDVPPGDYTLVTWQDRKSAGEGKGGSERVDIGGCRSIKKKKQRTKT